MRMSPEQRPWVFITRDKFFTTLPIMVFGQTSVGNSEFDVWHFFNQLFLHTLLFQVVYISVPSSRKAIRRCRGYVSKLSSKLNLGH